MGETEIVHTEKNNMTLAFGRFTQTYRERERERNVQMAIGLLLLLSSKERTF